VRILRDLIDELEEPVWALIGPTPPAPCQTESPGLRGFRRVGAPRFELGTSSPIRGDRRIGLVEPKTDHAQRKTPGRRLGLLGVIRGVLALLCTRGVPAGARNATRPGKRTAWLEY
jgi:hypothetical protein